MSTVIFSHISDILKSDHLHMERSLHGRAGFFAFVKMLSDRFTYFQTTLVHSVPPEATMSIEK